MSDEFICTGDAIIGPRTEDFYIVVEDGGPITFYEGLGNSMTLEEMVGLQNRINAMEERVNNLTNAIDYHLDYHD